MGTKKEKKKDISAVIADINKVMKYEAVMRVDSTKIPDIPTFPSGSFSLDRAMMVGGYPRGRLIEIAGPPSVGKTHMAITAMVQVQRLGGLVAYIDVESSVDLIRFAHLGLNIEELILPNSENLDYLEQALNIMEMLIPACDLIVYDSIGGSTPKAVYEGSAEDNHMGTLAKKLTQEVPKIGRLCEKHGCSVIFINQKRDELDQKKKNAPDSDKTPGGHNFRHHMSIRIFATKWEWLKKGKEDVIGHVIGAKIAKNKCGPPGRVAKITFLHEMGICDQWDVMNEALNLGILTMSGAYVKDKDKMTLGQGAYNAALFLMDNEEYYKNLRDAVIKSLSIQE